MVGIFLILFNFFGIKFFSFEEPVEKPISDIETDSKAKKSVFQPSEVVKAVYVTSWSAAREDYIDYVIDITKNTEINAIVVDIKDWSGYIAYDTQVPEAEQYNAERILISDIEAFLERFHKEGIYVIARITVFQDPVLAQSKPNLAVHQKSNKTLLWLDKSGLAWIDPSAREAWEYNIALAKDALSKGFDELNFDYVRFPSDGDLQDMSFPLWDEITPRNLIIKEFYKYIREEIPQDTISIDLFGLSTVSSNLGVGHNIEDAYQYFDFVCPMVYPSHYTEGFLGYQNPAEYPYEIVKYSMESAFQKLSLLNMSQPTKAKLRPWLQDFNLGAIYDAKMVRSQIEAVYDAAGDNFKGFMLWNSSNFYTKEAFQPTTPR